MKQHTTPCKDCPFRRGTGTLGGSEPEVYIGQSHGPFWLPCHSTHNYKSLEARLDHANTQCAGAAIHRANLGRADLMPPELLRLPADTDTVFASHEEFLAHYRNITPAEAAERLEETPAEEHMEREIGIAYERARQGRAWVDEAKRKEVKR